ncbi:hypothetical protein ACH6EH_06545 [Paenibacillus sp. JSM ZJ436]|uniref:hypothetical protein n=1 Tax=Paenibacillus sp. JSM ZJ436 TaxID=3376190 RepID=UPI00379EEDE9
MRKYILWLFVVMTLTACGVNEQTADQSSSINQENANDSTEEVTENKSSEIKSDLWSQVDSAYQDKEYRKAYRILFRQKDFRENEEYQSVYNYLSALEYFDSGNINAGRDYLKEIPNDFKGNYDSEIMREKQKYFSEVVLQNHKYPTDKPVIGLTATEVLTSTWGKPQKKNTTTTKNGKREQWVYGSGRYIYLEDGIVTAIQE